MSAYHGNQWPAGAGGGTYDTWSTYYLWYLVNLLYLVNLEYIVDLLFIVDHGYLVNHVTPESEMILEGAGQ